MLFLFDLAGINAQGWAEPEQSPRVRFIWLSSYPECEGKDSGNYTVVAVDESDAQCSPNSIRGVDGYLIAWKANGERDVIYEQHLGFSSRYPAGGRINLPRIKIIFFNVI